MSRGHKRLEKNIILMSVFIVVVISLGGLVEILPLIFQDQVRTPAEGVKPYPPLQLAGRDIYVREGCYNSHSQMIRPFRSETERYGPYSTAGEFVYDRPFQFGSKRTGPDLARVGGRYSDEDIAAAAGNVEGKTELDALVAYLQGLGTNRSLGR